MHGRTRVVALPLSISIVAASLALVAAGCGGSGTPSAQEQWAGSVCTQVLNWENQITKIASDAKDALSSPSAGLADTLKADAQDAVTATKQLATDLQNLPPAPGSNGQTVKELLNSFAADVSQIVDSLKASVDTLTSSSSVTDAVKTLAGAAGDASSVVAKGKSTLDSIEATASDLKQGFQDASQCQEVKKAS